MPKKIIQNLIVSGLVVALVSVFVPVIPARAAAVPALGTAADFSVLAAPSMSAASTGTTVSGNLGLSVGLETSRTGIWSVGGSEYFGASSVANTARTDALSAFNNLAGQGSNGAWGVNPWSPAPGVWTAASDTTFTGSITLNGGYDDVWIFQVGRDMTFSGSVALTGDAQACHVFWQIGRDATIASDSTFVGTLIAGRDITLVSNATVNGRILSLDGALTTDRNNISGPSCTTSSSTTGSITLTKSAVNGNGTFNFTGTGGIAPFSITTVGGTGGNTINNLAPGTYTIAENTPGTGWTKTGDTCTDVVVTAGNTATCAVTNTYAAAPATGSIIITKSAVNGNGTFSFTGTNGISAFSITTVGGTGSNTINNLVPGTYAITEGALATGWAKTSDTCASVAVTAGNTATCAVTNTYAAAPATGSIIITKSAVNGNGTFSFTGTGGIAPFSITTVGGTGNQTINNLTPGTYTITEGSVGIGWAKTSNTCASVAVTAGNTATCKIINTYSVSSHGTIATSLTQDTGSGAAPIVKAKFESLRNSSLDDDLSLPGAQFYPSGYYKTDKQFRVCGVVTDPDGIADIASVYADIWYPEETYLGASHETTRQGCGQMVQTECLMTPLSKQAGYETFCGQFPNTTATDKSVRTKNAGLPVFNGTYDYNEICKADGELMKEAAYVYCCDRTLSYEDPSGNYETIVYAQDKSGKSSSLLNEFTYMTMTAFETDFASIGYGNVKLNTEKIINGDLLWPTAGPLASVRNNGNTRLNMTVNQSDMGLGITGSAWNVSYKARVGNTASDWTTYVPNSTATLKKPLDLSETNEMDFGITITKFPPLNNGSYSGTMTLGAVTAEHLKCEGNSLTGLDVSPR